MPTIRQKRAFDKVLKGMPITHAMKEVGYSETTSANTGKLTNSDGWKELMDKHLPDEKLAEKHNEFLNSDRQEIGIKALDMGYKLKGSYAPEKSINLDVKTSTEELAKFRDIRDEYEKKLLEKITNEE